MIYESYSKEDCLDIQKIVNPDIWSHSVRINPSDFREIYVLTWEILDPKEEAIALNKLHEYLKSDEYTKKKLVDETINNMIHNRGV